MVDQQEKLVRVATALMVCLVPVYLFFLGRNVPLFADDYCRWHDSLEIAEVLALTRDEYLGWSGRFPVMFLNYFFFSRGEFGVLLLEVINAAMLGVACYLVIVLNGCSSFWARAGMTVCFIFLLWFMPAVFGEVVLWKTGSVQYFWSMVIATICLAPVLRFAIWGYPVHLSWFVIPLYAGVAFLGGAWLESLSPAVALIWFTLLLFARFTREDPVPRVLVVGAVCWTIGAAVLIMAPGNYERMDMVASDQSLWQRIMHIGLLVPRIPSRALLFLFIGFLLVSILSQDEDLRRRLVTSMAFFAIAVLAAFSMVVVPALLGSGRTAFATEYFMILATVSVFPCGIFCMRPSLSVWILRGGLLTVFAGCLVLLIIDMKGTLNTYQLVLEQDNQRELMVIAARQRGETSIELPPLGYGPHWSTAKGIINTGRLYGRDIGYDPDEWTNTCYASAHGLDQVKLLDR